MTAPARQAASSSPTPWEDGRQPPPGPRKPAGGALFEKAFGKKVGPALVAALAMWALGRLGWLDGLERAMVELSAIVAPQVGRFTPGGVDAAVRPTVLAVGDTVFESTFRERTPLDRRALAQLLEPVLAGGARVVAVDLDLSPVLDPTGDERAAQATLDAMLAKYAATTPIVLAIPFASDNPQRTVATTQWMQKLCTAVPRGQPGLHFAYPEVVQNGGAVTKWSEMLESLGQIAKIVGEGPAAHDGLAMPCNATAGSDDAPPFLDPLIRPGLVDVAIRSDRLQPLNVTWLASREATPILLDATQPLAPATLKGRPVFVGGTWGAQDRFATAVGRVPGVAVHAAVYHSVSDPIHALPEWVLVVLATLAGTVMLVVFERPWTRYFEELQALGEKPPLLARLKAERWTLAVAVLVVGGLVVAVLASGVLLAQATWFNFAPVVVALALRSAQSAAKAELEVQRRKTRTLEARLAKAEAGAGKPTSEPDASVPIDTTLR